MKVEVFCLCKSVSVDRLNSPTLTGLFDERCALGEPVLMEPFSVAILVRFFRANGDRTYRLSVLAKDETGAVVFGPIREYFKAAQMPRDSTVMFYHYVMPEGGLTFGKYLFSIEADGKQIASTPLYVTRKKE